MESMERLAYGAVDMAKYVLDVKPNALFGPVRSGWFTEKLVMEAIRRNLGVSKEEYNPPMFPLKKGKWNYKLVQLPQIYSLQDNESFKARYPKLDKPMIFDSTNTGISPEVYLRMNTDDFCAFGEKVYVNLLGTSNQEKQEHNLGKLMANPRFEFHISRLDDDQIIFDDKNDILGITQKGQMYFRYPDLSEQKKFMEDFRNALDSIKNQ
jgi:hypothetical protein